MKRSLTIMAITTGLISVLFLAAPINAQQVAFESQLICIAAPINPCTEEDVCGGEVKVFYGDDGLPYAVFDFITPLPDMDYHLYMGREFGPLGYTETQIGGVVTTDEDGVCYTGPILIDVEGPSGVVKASFSVESVVMGPPGCGDRLHTGFWISE